MSQSRIWCFTKQSDDETSISWMLSTDDNLPLDNPDPEVIQCLYYQIEEAPKTHKIHLQGFIVFKKRVRFNTVKKLFPLCHLEKAKGTQQQNIDYCSKSETRLLGPFKIGILEEPGKSTTLSICLDKLKTGTSLRDLAIEYPEVYVRHARNLESFRKLVSPDPPPWRLLTVTWIWGKTGSGKTRYCYEDDPKLFRVKDNGQWWDGYIDQDTILFDEFYGDIKCKQMLNYLDGYSLDLPVKGGFTTARWTKVFITSNIPPEQVYTTVPQDVKDAFIRRITFVKNFE